MQMQQHLYQRYISEKNFRSLRYKLLSKYGLVNEGGELVLWERGVFYSVRSLS